MSAYRKLIDCCAHRPENVTIPGGVLKSARGLIGEEITDEQSFINFLGEEKCGQCSLIPSATSKLQRELYGFPIASPVHVYSCSSKFVPKEIYLSIIEKPSVDHWCVKSFKER